MDDERRRKFAWSDLEILPPLARKGSLQGAAREIGVDHTTVGRRLDKLEASAGLVIFERDVRGLRITTEGRVLLERALQMEALAFDAMGHIDGGSERTSGLVRINTHEGFAANWLTPNMLRLRRDAPGLAVEIKVGGSAGENLGTNEADIAIRYRETLAHGETRHLLLSVRMSIWAARSYASLYGMPRRWEDLRRHQLIGLTEYRMMAPTVPWMEHLRGRTTNVLHTSTPYVYNAAIKAGLGLGITADYPVEDLVRAPLDPEISLPLSLITHETCRKRPHVTYVLEYLKEELEEALRAGGQLGPRPNPFS